MDLLKSLTRHAVIGLGYVWMATKILFEKAVSGTVIAIGFVAACDENFQRAGHDIASGAGSVCAKIANWIQSLPSLAGGAVSLFIIAAVIYLAVGSLRDRRPG